MPRRSKISFLFIACAGCGLLAAAAVLEWGVVLLGGYEVASKKGFIGLLSLSGQPIHRPMAFFGGLTQWEWQWLPATEWSRAQRAVLIPAWYPAAIASLLTVAASARNRTRITPLCATCGYSRLGLEVAAACPECGTVPPTKQ